MHSIMRTSSFWIYLLLSGGGGGCVKTEYNFAEIQNTVRSTRFPK